MKSGSLEEVGCLKAVTGPVACIKGKNLLQCIKTKPSSVCFHCKREFSEKKWPCLALGSIGGRLTCGAHFVHEYCGPCDCPEPEEIPLLPAHPVFGFDVGGVLVPAASSTDEDTLLGDRVEGVLPAEGAFETLARLVDRFGPGAVHIVSKAGKRVEVRDKGVNCTKKLKVRKS